MSDTDDAPASRWRRSRTRKSPSCSCMGSSAPTGRATRRCTSSTAPSSRSGPGNRWRWWRPRAPANRRCCTSPACSEHPDHGDVYIDGRATAILPDAERTRIRRNEIGFVYQSHHLLPEFTALENVMLPQMIRGLTRAEASKRAVELLELSRPERAAHPPAGGTLRRRAAARRDRARGRQCAAHSAGRRADRQPRPAHRRPRVRGADAAGARLRPRHHHRHPQHGDSPPAWTGG